MMIGQKIVVVGGTAGIGLAVARNAADCGAEVYIGSSNAQKLESTLGALQASSARRCRQRVVPHFSRHFEINLAPR